MSKYLDPVEVNRITSNISVERIGFKQLRAETKDILDKDIEDCAMRGFVKLDITNCGKISTISLKNALKSIMRSYADYRFKQVTTQMMRMIAQSESEMRMYNTSKDFRILIR